MVARDIAHSPHPLIDTTVSGSDGMVDYCPFITRGNHPIASLR